jgi:MATE family multidrug resistance protein
MSRYLAIRLLGAPAALSTLVLLGWFLGLQDSMRPLLLMLVTNGLNAALAVLLVYGAGMEAGGVALATVLAEHAGLLLAFFLARRRWRAGAAPGRAAIFIAARFRQLLGMNRDLSLRSLLLEAVFVALPAIGGRLGEVTLAANAVLMTLFTAAAYGLDGFAHATEAQVGRAVGARSGTDFRGAVRAGFISAGVLALLMSLAFAMLGLPLIRILTGLQEVRTEAATFLPYAAMVPVVAVWAFLYDGVFFGAARAAALRDGMLIAGLGFAAAAAALVPAFGNHGLWLAFLAFLGARGLILAVFYRQAQARAPFVGEVAPVTA